MKNKYQNDETNRPYEGDEFDALGYWLAIAVTAAVIACGLGYVFQFVGWLVTL